MKDIETKKSRAKGLSTLSLLALAAALLLTLPGHDAIAGQCIVGQIKEIGNWINPDPNTTGVTRVVFAEECRDAQTTTCSGNICSTTFGVKLVRTAKVWGKCTPTDCAWGKVDGVYTSEKWLRFFYDQGFAKRTVWGQIWSGGNDWLRLIVDTDFVDANRADYQLDQWMQRQ